MLAAQENVAQPAAAGFPGLDSIAEAGRDGHGSSSSSARQAGGGISISFWGPGLCAPREPTWPTWPHLCADSCCGAAVIPLRRTTPSVPRPAGCRN